MLCAGTGSAREASRATADGLIDVVDWQALATTLTARRLLPLLGERIMAIAGPRAPETFVAATRSVTNSYRKHNALLELVSIHAMDELRAAGIKSLVIKGPQLGRAVYGKLGRRASADIDLLVASEDLLGAVEVARKLGYRDPERTPHPDELPPLHYRLVHESPYLPMLELHWRMHWYEGRFARDTLDRSAGTALDRRASPDDEFTSLLLFYARDGFVDLRLACDIAAWWDLHKDELTAGAVDERIEHYPELERSLRAAVHVAESVVALPRGELLHDDGPLERRVRLATLLANPNAYGSKQQQDADTRLVDWLLTPPGGRREAVRRQLLAPSGTAGGQTLLRARNTTASLNQATRLSRRYALALLRVITEQRERRRQAEAARAS